jgi:hypothetical protein
VASLLLSSSSVAALLLLEAFSLAFDLLLLPLADLSSALAALEVVVVDSVVELAFGVAVVVVLLAPVVTGVAVGEMPAVAAAFGEAVAVAAGEAVAVAVALGEAVAVAVGDAVAVAVGEAVAVAVAAGVANGETVAVAAGLGVAVTFVDAATPLWTGWVRTSRVPPALMPMPRFTEGCTP